MTRKLGVALATLALSGTAAAAAPALASTPPGARFTFAGKLMADPGAGATHFTVDVTGGDRLALRLIIGAAQPLTFTANAGTRWFVVNGHVPSVATSAALHAGDRVNFTIRARRHASLADVLAKPAARVTDVANVSTVPGWLYLFHGDLTKIDTTAHTVSINVDNGNWRALRSMLGAPVAQSFTYGPTTTFIQWGHGVPHVIGAGDLTVGDEIALRIKAPRRTALAALEQIAPVVVTDHAPQPQR
jgi:hypothetical protein